MGKERESRLLNQQMIIKKEEPATSFQDDGLRRNQSARIMGPITEGHPIKNQVPSLFRVDTHFPLSALGGAKEEYILSSTNPQRPIPLSSGMRPDYWPWFS